MSDEIQTVCINLVPFLSVILLRRSLVRQVMHSGTPHCFVLIKLVKGPEKQFSQSVFYYENCGQKHNFLPKSEQFLIITNEKFLCFVMFCLFGEKGDVIGYIWLLFNNNW